MKKEKNGLNCFKTFIFPSSQSEFDPDDFSLHFFTFVIYSYFRLISLIENACKWTTPWNALFVQNFMVKWALSQTITGQNVKKCREKGIFRNGPASLFAGWAIFVLSKAKQNRNSFSKLSNQTQAVFLIRSSFRRSSNRRLDLVRACPDRLNGDP